MLREMLMLGIFVAFSLIMQIFFLRVCKDTLEIANDDPRMRKMIRMIYVNLGVYIVLIMLLFMELRKQW